MFPIASLSLGRSYIKLLLKPKKLRASKLFSIVNEETEFGRRRVLQRGIE
jgi:hypothetical protein